MALTLLNICPQPLIRPPAPPARQTEKMRPLADVWHPAADDPDEKQVVRELRQNIVEYEAQNTEFMKNAELELDFLAGKMWVDPISGQDRAQDMVTLGRSAFTIDLVTPSIDLVISRVSLSVG
jgi:hypothetical protein